MEFLSRLGIEEFKNLPAVYQEKGWPGVASRLQEALDPVFKEKLDIAITGESGSGKSTFINAMRGLTPEDKEAAKIDVRKPTVEPTNFKAKHVGLAKEINAVGKTVYFVRSKVDEAAKGKNNDEEKILKNCLDIFMVLQDWYTFCIQQRLSSFRLGIEEFKNLPSVYQEKGWAGVASYLQETLDPVLKAKLDIAITGESGSGKSTFINAMRGLTPEDKEAAEIDVRKPTVEPTKYAHPCFPNVIFWDLTRIKNLNCRQQEYLERVNIQQYDLFIIFSSKSFKAKHVGLAKEINAVGKTVYFVRSKADEAAKGKKNNDEEKILKNVRKKCNAKLERAGIKSPSVFLISSFYLERYDFDDLRATIAEPPLDLKRQVFLLSLPPVSLKVLEEKKKLLEGRLNRIALYSCAVATVPIPGLSFACDTAILATEITFYREQFGLTEKALLQISKKSGKSVDEIKAAIKSPLALSANPGPALLAMLAKYAGGELVETVASFIPFIGSLVAGGISYATTYSVLQDSLEKLSTDALCVLKRTLEE
ncbi:interferon-inducible GTPase 5-like [Latimeria chalumnae]|uniref:interferon-inducible GTPase 5-like n=1 Tax=Latimeria chalumnae TaxID=7897 RepID=UPI00313B9424